MQPSQALADSRHKMLSRLVARYLWWKPVDEVTDFSNQLIAQVMNIGDFADVNAMAKTVGDDRLRSVLTNAEAGQFTPRSWAYWHYRLGLAQVDKVPPLPARNLQ